MPGMIRVRARGEGCQCAHTGVAFPVIERSAKPHYAVHDGERADFLVQLCPVPTVAVTDALRTVAREGVIVGRLGPQEMVSLRVDTVNAQPQVGSRAVDGQCAVP